MQCLNCNAPLEENSMFCGRCGNQVTTLSARGAGALGSEETVLMQEDSMHAPTADYGSPQPATSPSPWFQAPASEQPTQGSIPTSFPPRVTPPVPSRSPLLRRNKFLAIILVLFVVAASVGTIALIRSKNNTSPAANGPSNSAGIGSASGQVSFSDTPNGQGHSDTLSISINGLTAPPSGSHYDAWIVNEGNEKILSLGQLTGQGQTFSLKFAGNGTNLVGFGNKIEVTQEQGNVNLPSGKIVLAGIFPPQAFVHIKHLLFSFPTTPGQIGLLVGLLGQTQQLNAQAALLKSVASSRNPTTTRCAAQSIRDIIRGTHGLTTLPWASACTALGISEAGDGFGLQVDQQNGYAPLAGQHAGFAATQPDSTPNIKTHAKNVEIAITTIEGSLNTIDKDADNLVANPNDTSKVQEIVTLSNQVFNGVNTGGAPTPDQAGTLTAYNEGHAMAVLPLKGGTS
ncbi:MAG: anti-sigma factor [Chloroflexota bacterium]|nr:anti-sigma factor [Chloroflexota bacterium]